MVSHIKFISKRVKGWEKMRTLFYKDLMTMGTQYILWGPSGTVNDTCNFLDVKKI